MALVLVLLAAVAGGNLAVTTSPARPHVGQRVTVWATGQVGDTGGRLYIYRNTTRGCAQSARGERRRGIKLADVPITGSFDLRRSFVVRRARREWVCGYLYAITCDPAGRNCAPATGLPPDAGFDQVAIRVRPASH